MACRNVPPMISVPEASMQLTISASSPDLPGTLRNAVLRDGAKVPVKLTAKDFEVYRTELMTQ